MLAFFDDDFSGVVPLPGDTFVSSPGVFAPPFALLFRFELMMRFGGRMYL